MTEVLHMSQFGPKLTCRTIKRMSDVGSEADIKIKAVTSACDPSLPSAANLL
jgi:hypothetical protein